jgi:hypothetical protein
MREVAAFTIGTSRCTEELHTRFCLASRRRDLNIEVPFICRAMFVAAVKAIRTAIVSFITPALEIPNIGITTLPLLLLKP